MRILWAVSSVGKGHVIRDIAIVSQLEALADVEIDWLAPYPADGYLRRRGYRVLECSSRLAGSGKAYEQVFSRAKEEFNLMDYIRVETKLHKSDFAVSAAAWGENDYAVIVGDEAFWLLNGFASRWAEKPAPFVFLTDFIGTKAMRFRLSDMFTAWSNNVGFTMSHMGPDVPFIAIPLDYHFEQEHFMGHRLGCYGIGESMTMRDHTPQAIAGMARQLMARQTARVEVDPGVEVAKIVLDTAREDRSDRQG